MTQGINLAVHLTVMFDEIERHRTETMTPEAYPGALESHLALRNGETLRIRPIRPDDDQRLVELYSRLSRQTAYQRFFTVMRRLPSDWIHYFANVDYRRRLALVAERETVAGVEIVGVGRYEPSDERGRVRSPSCWRTAIKGRGSARSCSTRSSGRAPSAGSRASARSCSPRIVGC